MKKLLKDERGLGHIVMILVAVVVIAGIGAVGYKVSQNGKDSKKTSDSKVVADKSAVDACNKVWHDKDLCKFTGNYAIDKLSFKMVMTTTDINGGVTSATYLSDGKGNISMSGSNKGEQMEMIWLDNISYLKDTSDGTWIKFPANNAAAPKDDPARDVKFDTATDLAASSNYTYKKLGKEACGNLTCFKYQMVDKSQPNMTQYFWFDDKDYRMQHYNTKDENGTNDMVITYQSVKITAPSPTKDFSAAAGIDPSQLSGSTE